MSVVPPTPELEQLAHRPFSFYPAIRNIVHNEWVFRRATWSEILVANTRDQFEVWIPRRFLGEISSVEDPVMIVGLSKELEFKAGTVWPHERQVIEMPRLNLAPAAPAPEPAGGPAPIVGIRTERSAESRIGRLIAAVLVIGVAGFVLLVAVISIGPMRTRTVFTNRDQAYLLLNRQDDYFAIVSKLGRPAEDRWRERGELQYRLMGYPDRGYSAILMGSDQASARYVGAMDRDWHVLHYVELPGGGSTRSMLRGLDRF